MTQEFVNDFYHSLIFDEEEFVDDCYPSLLFDDEEEEEDEIFPVSDSKYEEGLQFQEALMGAFSTGNNIAQDSPSDDLMLADDFYFSLLFDDEEEEEYEIFPVSDSKYEEGLQFQEALMGAFSTCNNIAQDSPSDDLMLADDFYFSLLFDDQKEDKIMITSQLMATKESGESLHCFCEICVERKDCDEMFRNESCVHSFCCECISKHVAAKIQDGITVVSCPGLECKGVLELDDCRPMLPKDVMERWDEALCRALFGSQMVFYCPFKDCSAMLVNDNEGGEVIRESECPFCHRLFCAQCYVPWHPGIECEEFQRLNENERGREDFMLRELALEKKWRRCPNCNYFVERTEGCLHMTCRCAFQFCYGCGASWTSDHGGCQTD